MIDLSIIIPVYNEEVNIPKLLGRLTSVIDQLHLNSEFIFVNDGSRDRTIDVIKQFAAKNTSVKYIDFSRNFGHQVAVSAGLDNCSGNAVVIIDADLQDPPELIADMYRKYKDGFEVVYAKRRKKQMLPA